MRNYLFDRNLPRENPNALFNNYSSKETIIPYRVPQPLANLGYGKNYDNTYYSLKFTPNSRNSSGVGKYK